jgi:hypothetical protein
MGRTFSVLALVLLAGLAWGQGKKADKPAPKDYAFLLPIPVFQKLDLSADQKGKVLKALEAFVSEHAKALGALRADLNHARAAGEKARAAGDRAALAKAQAQMADVNKRLAKFRAELEPKALAVLTEQQKKRYRELKKSGGRPAFTPPSKAELVKLRPLTELGGGEYKGFQGGLYPGGKNERPAAHEAAGVALAKAVRPLGPDGKPSAEGKIVLLSVGMSNTSQVFTAFQRLAGDDEDKAPAVVLVNGAQGGMTARAIQDPDDGGPGTRYWAEVDKRLKAAGVTRAQVQAVWIKQADAGPREGFPRYAQTLQSELTKIVRLLPKRFPNIKLAYLSSRTSAVYAKTPLNPEPYAFESGLSVKWLIERQLKGDKELNFDPKKGAVAAPWLSWGPYLWAGTSKRADGFFYEEKDFASDGTHPSPAGQRKVAELLLRFFKTDATARPWFVKKG